MAVAKVIYKSSANATPEVWMDATTATAAAGDITSPKTAMLADGVVTTGTGSGYTAEDWLDVNKPVGDIVCTTTFSRYGAQSLLMKRANINNVRFTESVYASDNCFQSSGIKIFVGQKVTDVCNSTFQAATSLIAVDVLGLNGYSNTFTGCTNLETLILRGTSITLLSANAFNNTPFKNGGSGGTIYIPKSLYDHLGDGTSLDYKAATNWSTFDGYGTITWAQIEGSIYETQYADGTPISG